MLTKFFFFPNLIFRDYDSLVHRHSPKKEGDAFRTASDKSCAEAWERS